MSTFRQPLPTAKVAVIQANWQRLCDDVARAAEHAARRPDDVRIVGVTKYVDAATAGCLVAAGCRDLGENRPQQLWQKVQWMQDNALAPQDVRWHLIGHLQRNKIRRTVPLIHLLHSVDSQRLAMALSEESQASSSSMDVLLEVNVTGDDAKTGLSADDARTTLEQLLTQQSVHVKGLMGMAGIDADASQCRQQFAAIRQLRDAWQAEYGIPLPELSMGMSGDFAAAIAEGATIIRVGTRLFQGVA